MQIGYVIYIFTSVFIQIYFLDTYYKFTYFLREKETGDEIKYNKMNLTSDTRQAVFNALLGFKVSFTLYNSSILGTICDVLWRMVDPEK